MSYIIFPIEFGSPEYDEAVQLRTKVLREPLNMAYTVEQLEAEYSDTHLACYNEQYELLGCLILTKIDEKTMKMRQVAVVPDLQKQGIGKAIVQFAECYARHHQIKKMTLHAREIAIPFYERLDYQKIGELFQEVGINHFKMFKDITN